MFFSIFKDLISSKEVVTTLFSLVYFIDPVLDEITTFHGLLFLQDFA